MSTEYDPVKDGLFTRFFLVVVGLGIVGVLVYYANTSNLFGTQAATTIVGTTATTSLSSLEDGLVGHWTFDGGTISGTTVTDVSGNGHSGTLTNGPTKTIGQVGQGISFDGTDDYVTPPATGNGYFYDSFTKHTTSIWVKAPANTGVGSRLIYEEGGSTSGFSINYRNVTGGNTIKYSTCTGTTLTIDSKSAFANGLPWTLVTVVYDEGLMKLYINGVLETTDSNGTSVPAHTSHSGLGGVNGSACVDSGNPWEGSIDDVRFYDRALSADEVYRLYTNGKPNVINSKSSQGDTLTEGLVGYWKLDEGSGTSAADTVGNSGIAGTLVNSPVWTTGKVGGALSFNGSNQYVTIPDSNNVLDIDNTVTVSAWVNANSWADAEMKAVFIRFLGYYMTVNPSGNVGVYGYGKNTPGYHWSNRALSTGAWHHIVTNINADGFRIYINGVLDKTVSDGGALNTWISYNAAIGSNPDSPARLFNGKIDEVRVYNRTLSDEEVARLYKDTTPNDPENGLVGHWTFDGPDIKGTTAYDRSGKGSNGTLTNGPTKAIGKLGQALSFDGTNDYLSVPDHTSQHFGTGDFTYSFWVNFDQTQTGVLFSNGTYVDGIMFYRYDNGTTYLWIGNANGQSSAWNPPTNKWQHVVLRRESGTVYMYADGVQQFTLGLPGNVTDVSASGMRIGYGFAGSANTVLDGKIDDFRMYNRALSVEEIKDLYERGSGTKVKICKVDSVQDANANTYYTMAIGSQCWLDRNMNVGTRISAGTSQTNNGTVEKYCYNNLDSNCTTNHPNKPDGGLYEWNEAMQYSTTEGAQGICPVGFHIPTDAEWHTLEKFLTDGGGGCDPARTGDYSCSSAGIRLQPAGSVPFEANLSGRRFATIFNWRDSSGLYWTSTESGISAWYRGFEDGAGAVLRGVDSKTGYGFSVRCIQD